MINIIKIKKIDEDNIKECAKTTKLYKSIVNTFLIDQFQHVYV